MTDTTAQHIATRDDADLQARFIAAAEQAHVDNPEQFVLMNLGKLISTDIGDGTTITSVHAYIQGVYDAAVAALPASPGSDPAGVTDAQLTQAITAVWAPPTE